MNLSLLNLERQTKNTIGARLLQIVAGLVVVYRFYSEVRFAPFLFEINNSNWSSSGLMVYVCLGFWLVGGTGLLIGYFTRISTLLVLVGYVVLESLTVTHDGGDNVLRIVLLYMLLFHDRLSSSDQIKPGARVFLHNLGIVLIHLQLVVLYLVSGTLKLQGPLWFNGTALYYITNVEAFSTNWQFLRSFFFNPIFVAIATYMSVLYQIGFPFMLGNRLHLLWVLIGLSFHVGIFMVMGLTTFSAIMIGLILFTVRDNEWLAIQSFGTQMLPKLHTIWQVARVRKTV